MSFPIHPTRCAAIPARRASIIAAALVSLTLVAATAASAADSWPTKSHDARRTAQSKVAGPATAKKVAIGTIPQGGAINIAATVRSDGTAYFGTWGTVQDNGAADRESWDKFSGDLFAWKPSFAASSSSFAAAFTPAPLDPVPYCHDYASGTGSPVQCGGSLTDEMSWWNGTVEGTPVLSPDEKVVYVGRGDGKVYAIEAATGLMLWDFSTCNDVADCDKPTTHPEAGGEVVAGLLLRGSSELYVGTFAVEGAEKYESTALYKLDAASGALVWRYPGSGSLGGTFVAAPALSPDGNTIYAATMCGPSADCTAPGYLYAFDPSGNLRWAPVPLADAAKHVAGAWTLAVGTDGTVFVGGGGSSSCNSAFVAAYKPTDGSKKWGPVSLPSGLGIPCANRAGGIALREVSGKTTRVYVSTNFTAEFSAVGSPTGGRIFALDPATGKQSWGTPYFDPSRSGGYGNALYPTLDANGVLYTGSSGAYAAGSPAYPVQRGARVFAVSEAKKVLWSYDAKGVIGYSNPVLGGDGVLRFGDMRARNVDPMLRPTSDPAWQSVDQTPAFYAISGT